MCFRQPEHMDNTDYLMIPSMLIKVYKQHAGPYGYCKTVAAKIKNAVDNAIQQASDERVLPTSSKIADIEKAEDKNNHE